MNLDELYPQISQQLLVNGKIKRHLINEKKLCELYGNIFLEEIKKKYSKFGDIKEILYLYLNQYIQRPTCKICGKELILRDRGVSGGKSYGTYCNMTCSKKDSQIAISSVIKNLEKQNGVTYQQVLDYLLFNKYDKNLLSLSEQFYLCKNKKQIGICEECGLKSSYLDSIRGYGRFCCVSCSSKNKDQIEKSHYTRHKIDSETINSFLQKYNLTSLPLNERIYLFLNKITQVPCCRKCEAPTAFFSQKEGYQKYCSKKCFQKDLPQKAMSHNLDRFYLSHCNVLSNLVDLQKSKFSFDEYKEKLGEGKYTFCCNKCNSLFEDYLNYNGLPRCLKCFPFSTSIEEKNITSLLLSLGLKKHEIELRNQSKIKRELDLYMPKYNLAIEYNGLMWHSFGKDKSQKFNNVSLEKTQKNKHLNKTEGCQEQGIQLLHIFENEWLTPQKQDIWKSIIKSKLGVNDRVYARSLVIQPVSYQESCDFLDNNHLQGADKSSIRLGLYNPEGELFSLMTFGRSRYDKKVAWELLRFSTKKGITVVGGASKLFNHFKNNYLQPGESIVSYADRRHSNGNLYEQLGFILSHISSPNYFYFKENNYVLESRLEYQKHKLRDKLQVFDENLTESENMYNNGYRKIYDSGNLVYIY